MCHKMKVMRLVYGVSPWSSELDILLDVVDTLANLSVVVDTLANLSVVVVAVNVGEDCPVFDGLYEFCQLATGGSVGKLSSFSYIVCGTVWCRARSNYVIVVAIVIDYSKML